MKTLLVFLCFVGQAHAVTEKQAIDAINQAKADIAFRIAEIKQTGENYWVGVSWMGTVTGDFISQSANLSFNTAIFVANNLQLCSTELDGTANMLNTALTYMSDANYSLKLANDALAAGDYLAAYGNAINSQFYSYLAHGACSDANNYTDNAKCFLQNAESLLHPN